MYALYIYIHYYTYMRNTFRYCTYTYMIIHVLGVDQRSAQGQTVFRKPNVSWRPFPTHCVCSGTNSEKFSMYCLCIGNILGRALTFQNESAAPNASRLLSLLLSCITSASSSRGHSSCSLSVVLSGLSLSHTHTLSLSLSHTHTHTLSLSLPHPHTCLHVGPAHRGLMTRVFPRPRHAPH